MVDMIKQLRECYAGKKVFLTGHTGFKGSWLLKMFSLLGAEVKGYALEPKTTDDLFYLIEGEKLCQSVIGDIRDKQKLIQEIEIFQPDFTFHLAAQPLVRLSYEIPAETFEVNAIGTAYVLEGVRNLNKGCHVIVITTDKVYHNNEWSYPYRENDRLGGYDPYSASKACTELVIDSYRNSFFNAKDYQEHNKAIAVARAGNVIGGGDWSKDRLIPDIARALGKDEKVAIRNPAAIRPWQHVLEPLLGYLLLGARLFEKPGAYSYAYNFGPYTDDALTVEQMVKQTLMNWKKGSYHVIECENQPHEAGLLKLDINKAIAEIGWKPKMSAAQAIEMTVEWYKQFYLSKESISSFTEKQIVEFFND